MTDPSGQERTPVRPSKPVVLAAVGDPLEIPLQIPPSPPGAFVIRVSPLQPPGRDAVLPLDLDLPRGQAASCRIRLPAPPLPGLYRVSLCGADGTVLDGVRLAVYRHPPYRPWVDSPEDPHAAGLPPDRWTGTGRADSTYVTKEKNLIPEDFDFRYAHHDFRFLDAHAELLGHRILHLGCNLGIGSIILARLGFLVHGVDIQRAAIERALALRGQEPPHIAERVTFQWASFRTMDIPDRWFDAAVAFDVLEHLHPPDLELLLDRVTRALRPGGHLLCHVPLGDSFADPADVRRFDPDGFREEISTHLDVVSCEVVEEHDGQGNRRIDLVARKQEVDDRISVLLSRLDSFDSSFFNPFYTPAKARGAIRRLLVAVRDRTPFSLVRLGDNEIRFLAWARIPLPGESPLGEQAEMLAQHLGVHPCRLDTARLRSLQDELLLSAREADVLGTHRHTPNRDWHEEANIVLDALGLPYGESEVDVVWNAELLDRGFLLPLLGLGRVLLVGNPAPRFASLLADTSWRARYASAGMPAGPIDLAGAVFVPHEGTAAIDQLEETWERVRGCRFDIALLAASVVGKLLAGRIRRELGRIALDIGWNMQFLAGVPSPVGGARQPARRGFRNLFRGRGEPGGMPLDGPRTA